MRLAKIIIRNYRLLTNAELEVDPKTTLIVGRNNTAKTSCFACINKILSKDPFPFSFDDYPLQKRSSLYDNVAQFLAEKISIEDLCKQVESISIDFIVNYALDDPEDNLGALSPFIIDLDADTTTALIRIECKLKSDEKIIWNAFKQFRDESIREPNDLQKAIKNNFQKIFEMAVYAINPNDPEDVQRKKHKELVDLFPTHFIQAERRLGEDGTQDNSLSSLIATYFEVSEEELDESIVERVMELRNTVKDSSDEIQHHSDEILSTLVNDAIGFGYPNAEELQLGVTTQLSIDEQIKNRTQLTYTAGACKETLPANYNGLGYKNLIKMEFLLSAFAKKIESNGCAGIPLLFIEEPESHMHPQMQRAFAEYLESFLEKISTAGIQTFLTSHSAHIANTMDFSKIRYARKTANGIVYKNLSTFAKQNSKNIDFIKKYLTLTRCDLFFADKAIFVEGASERLLIPDMIEKCAKAGDFNSQTYKLPEQYYTLIEIGGAYAYLFIPFTEFLGIPCLILTDLDSVAARKDSQNRARNRSVPVSEGETTSNETLKWWVRKVKGIKNDGVKITLSDITSLSFEDKTLGKCHLEFQVKEHGLCGRSLEEAIRNVNRSYFNIESNATEKDIEFTGNSKTDFALNLIYEHGEYIIPSYIRDGLVWLNDQRTLE